MGYPSMSLTISCGRQTRGPHRSWAEGDLVKYRLQIQLKEASRTETHEDFNPCKAWGEEYLDLGIVTLFAPLVDHETRMTSFNRPSLVPPCLSLIKPCGPLDYNSVNWLREACAGAGPSFLGLPKSSPRPVFKNPCKYIINVYTSHVMFSGIHGNAYVTVVGTKASTTRTLLENGGYDFEADTVSRFVTHDEDVGEPLYIFVHHDSQECWRRRLSRLDFFVSAKWNLGKLQITSKSPRHGKRTTTFYVWKWLIRGELAFAVGDHAPKTAKAELVCRELHAKYFEYKC